MKTSSSQLFFFVAPMLAAIAACPALVLTNTTLYVKDYETTSKELQTAWYDGDADVVLEKVRQLELLAKQTTNREQLANIHYLAALGWRNHALLVSDRTDSLNQAIQQLKLSIELDPGSARSHALLAHVTRSLIGSGRRDHATIQQAIVHREKAFELSPNDPQVLMMEAYALIAIPESRGGDVNEGIAAGLESIGRFSLDPPNDFELGIAQNWAIIGNGYRKTNDIENAIKAYRKALEFRPNWKQVREQILPQLIQQSEMKSPRKIQHQSLKQKIQNELNAFCQKADRPGATLAIAHSNDQVLKFASGVEDFDSQEPMQVDSIMFCGSTGKTFVSALALKLVAEGKLDLDTLASEYVSKTGDHQWYDNLPNSDEITIRSLMNHTSGLPRYLFQPEFLADLKAHPRKSRPSPAQNLAALHGAEPIHPVGNGWAYSDSNYLVLGLILEQITGKTFYELAQEHLLDPLDLLNTRAATQPKLEGLIQGHIGSVNLFDLPQKTVVDGEYVMDPNFEWCGGGFVTTTSDLAKWMRALHSGKVLDPKTHNQLVSPVDFQTGKPSEQGYGLGSFVWKTESGIYFGHSGIMPGYLTQIEYHRDHGFAIALQTNTDEGMGKGLHECVQSIADLVIAEIDND